MTKSLSDQLKAAKALIDTPEKWTKGAFARDRDGDDVYETDGDTAVCWCAVGAINKAFGCHAGLTVVQALYAALPADFQLVASFNDHPDTTHADVMALFDRAIAEASE